MLSKIVVIGIILLAVSSLNILSKLEKNVIISYILWWMLLLIISIYNPLGLYSVSNKVYFLLMIHIMSLFGGFLIFFKSCRKKIDFILLKKKHDKIISKKPLKVIFVILNIILLYYFVQYRSYINADFAMAREAVFTVGSVFKTSIEIIFFNWIITVFTNFAAFIICFSFLVKNIKNTTTILSFTAIILKSFIGSGRFTLIYLCIMLVFTYYVTENIYLKSDLEAISKSKTRKTKFIVFIVIIIGIMIMLTARRMGVSVNSLKSLHIATNEFFLHVLDYTIAPFRAFDYGLLQYTESISWQFGKAFFAGVDEIVGNIIKLFGSGYVWFNQNIGQLTQSTIFVGKSSLFNALYTAPFIFYYDFGFWGIIIDSIILGILTKKAIVSFEKKGYLSMFFLSAYLFNTIMLTSMRWTLQSPSSILTIIILMLIYLKERKHYG